ncbi:MAG TPA: helix-turn-helix transcriptional regulator [Flavisolibacter sp.]|nr:helix-turn-helix transcriptional regulator [Flavisolibacter sp.]
MTKEEPIHEGRNIKRMRERMGIKQLRLATDLGLTQQGMSAIENRERLDTELLEKVAKAMNTTPEEIQNFDEDKFVYSIQNNYDHTQSPSSNSQNFNCTFNIGEHFAEALEENRRLVDKMTDVFERFIQSEKENKELLQKLIEKLMEKK